LTEVRYKLSGGWGGKLSFQCLRPSASLRAAGKNTLINNDSKVSKNVSIVATSAVWGMSNVRRGAFWTHSRQVAEAPCQFFFSKIILLSPPYMHGYLFVCFVCLFFTRSGRLGFASVPDFQNPPFGVCTRVYHFLTMWYNTGGQQLQSAFFLEWGYHSRQSPIQVLTVPMLLHFCTRNRVNRCFNIVRPLALEFGLLRMVRQPSADTHVIWVARHKVTRPQTILKFRPPSSLDYRTRYGSQSYG
jgi:hypothetical protein